ncbi:MULTISPECIES: restriction endonuclease subunit S [Acinetobacter]|uniref:Type-1 restriction enzyme EcoprrI specificity protein n=1 Tax=Acinetobacter higginsii TaxID=70347 RepID=N9R015_9GAMM|nr:restriction endonuclease subunit S [Acinetobacter higginsii]ENX51419.1 type-1 restriction enzyme EcoprrI specificity protein [Acinetobacter higginsii]
MSNTDFMQKLLDGAQVEWKAVSEIFHLKNGYTPSTSKKEFWENGSVPWFRMDDIRENGQILGDSLQKISESAVKGGKLFPANSIIISTSATIGEHALITVPYLANQRFTNLSLKDSYVKVFDMKFIFYYCFLLADWCKKNTTMSSFASVDMDGFRKFQIPIPSPENPKKSLEIQAEIVRILDAFTAMTAELTAELKLRNQQYQYFRDKLLTFDMSEAQSPSDESGRERTRADESGRERTRADESGRRIEAKWMTLRDVGTWYGGGTPSKSHSDYWENGTIPWVSPKDMGRPIVDSAQDYITEDAIENSSTKLVPANSIAIVVRSSILDKLLPSALIPVPVALNQDMKAVIPHNHIMPSYLAHMIRSRGEDILRAARKTGGSVASIESSKLFSFYVPIPHLDEQKRIVTILDKFDTLTSSITEGLPREIELRQKQYEYYRDLLLSFPQSSIPSH